MKNYLIQQQKINNELNRLGKKLYDRFSANLLVGSLGELFFYTRLFKNFFEKIKINKERKNKCDFIGYKDKNIFKIEVKSRYLQNGNPVLSHVHHENFDYLVFIHFKENYKIHYWCILSSKQVKAISKNGRLKICNELEPIFENKIFKQL